MIVAPHMTVNRHDFLRTVHRRFEPRSYLEIGINDGGSLALARCRSIAIDPAFAVTRELDCHVAMFRRTSDDFFARPAPTAHFEGLPIDLAFIDGLHLFEFALRDFINVERHAEPASVIILDDMLPRNAAEASRERQTSAWTGDVFKVAAVLAKFRSDLVLRLVDTHPTGLLVVFGADPTSRVLTENYHDILNSYIEADPQDVPPSVLTRSEAVTPSALLDCGVWKTLVDLRHAPTDRASALKGIRQAVPGPVAAATGRSR